MTFPQAEYIAVNDIELEVFQTGEGRPIVLCHGWPEHAYSWRNQVEPLSQAGYHVIVPNQRGYGHSSRPNTVEDYDIVHLTDDLIGLINHFGYKDALFVGHDWGAIVVWNLALMHPDRVAGVVNLSVPFMELGPSEWVGFWESRLGGDFYIVHFNRQPGVADEAFDNHREQFLRNIYRTNQWQHPPAPAATGMPLIHLSKATEVPGDSLMEETDLQVFADAFAHSGFSGGINWYRNFTRNWDIIRTYEQRITQPTLMIYGDYDSVPKSEALPHYVADLEVQSLACGHWIQQERPDETNRAILDWIGRRYPT